MVLQKFAALIPLETPLEISPRLHSGILSENTFGILLRNFPHGITASIPSGTSPGISLFLKRFIK